MYRAILFLTGLIAVAHHMATTAGEKWCVSDTGHEVQAGRPWRIQDRVRDMARWIPAAVQADMRRRMTQRTADRAVDWEVIVTRVQIWLDVGAVKEGEYTAIAALFMLRE